MSKVLRRSQCKPCFLSCASFETASPKALVENSSKNLELSCKSRVTRLVAGETWIKKAKIGQARFSGSGWKIAKHEEIISMVRGCRMSKIAHWNSAFGNRYTDNWCSGHSDLMMGSLLHLPISQMTTTAVSQKRSQSRWSTLGGLQEMTLMPSPTDTPSISQGQSYKPLYQSRKRLMMSSTLPTNLGSPSHPLVKIVLVQVRPADWDMSSGLYCVVTQSLEVNVVQSAHRYTTVIQEQADMYRKEKTQSSSATDQFQPFLDFKHASKTWIWGWLACYTR